jgi:cytochrome c-type biogenesis protein CcmH/NrfG
MTPPRRQAWRLLIVIAACVAVAVGAGAWWLSRGRPAVPPDVDLTGADEEVASAVASARREVLGEPRSAKRWGHLGMVLRAHGFASESSACFEEAERLDPREPRWPYYRGLTLVLTDPGAGLACLRRAVARLDGRPLEPRFRLAEVLLEQGHLDEAEEQLRHLRTQAPDHPRGRLLQARLASSAQDTNKAIDSLQDCWDDPHVRRQARLLAAEAWQRRGDGKRGEQMQAAAAQLPPDVPWPDPFVEEVEQLAVGVRARLSLAVGLHQQGRADEAVALLERLVEARPREVAAWILLGQFHRERGRRPQAERALSRAVALDPKNVDGWFGLGMVRLDARPEAAADAFRAAIRLKPDHVLAHYYLGECLRRTGDRQGARREYQAALRCQPDHEPARQALADLDRAGAPKP